ncbi:DMT family transporter [Bacillus sp. B190/17]|uniref:DMT family transporter n=1 Tax=Bacillus lumedeiriae TaxID=3058829 RepID=A0ABW8I5G6_9BACI
MEGAVAYQSRTKGMVMVLASALFWGASGVIAQFLFQQQGIGVEWLVTVRLLVAGLLLLAFSAVKEKKPIFDIWKDRFSWPSLILFSLFGMIGVQYTFFSAIQHGNAATATVLQYLAPVLIVLYLAIRSKARPASKEIIAVLLSVLGTFFLVTGGNPNELAISGQALFWGLSSSIALAIYTLQPLKLLQRWGSILIVGWGMTVAGVGFTFVHPPWKFEGTYSLAALAGVSFVIIFGTLLSFYLYSESLNYLRASETSLLACAEPLSAVFLSVFLLRVPFGFGEWFGTACIIITVLILSREKK